MRRRALVWLAVSLVLLSACREGAGSPDFGDRQVGWLVLTPSDLGPGYRLGDDTACGGFSPDGAHNRFAEFVRETQPVACAAEIVYIWGGTPPTGLARAVDSAAVVFDDEADARRAMELREALITLVTGESPRDFEEVPRFGHEALRFRNGGFDVPPGAGVFWRNGNMIAVVFAGGSGLSAGQAVDIALALARKQQRRIDNPKPPHRNTAAEAELPLDDPSLDAPIYWLGREFQPGGGLSALRFSEAHAYGGSGGQPAFTAEIDYRAADVRQTDGVKLGIFRPDSFARFEGTVLGRLVRDTPCATATDVQLPGGHAVIWAGFAKPTRPPCPAKPYDRYFAYVFLKGAVVTVNQPLCYYPCLANTHGSSDPYNKPRGLTAIARALTLRPSRP